jgi:hypothetical protein
MKTFYATFLICASILSFSPSSNAQEGRDYSDETPGSFVAIEVGPSYILSDGGSGAGNPLMIYFNVGMTLNKLFRQSWENQNFTLGPRVGLGFGDPNTPGSDVTMFYDIIANFRYTPGNGENMFRPYVEGGPGLGNYTGAAVHVDLGAGLDIFYNDKDSVGVTAHYNEFFTGDVERSVTLLGSLSHHW